MERKVVVVAPTFNEKENIQSFLEAVLVQKVEVLISDSHSSDGTAEIVKKFAAKDRRVHYLDVEKRGLGLALSKGLDYATETLKADVLVTMEADMSNDPKQLPEFIKKLENADVVIGSRYISGGAITNWSWWRKILSWWANLVLRILALSKRLHEFTNLYRVFSKDAWIEIRGKVSIYLDWLFVPAFAFEVLDTKLRIVENPIIYFDRFGGRSKMQTPSYTIDLLRYALRYRIQKWASVFKFAVVGGLSFVINTIILVVGVNFGMLPSIAGVVGAELAILFGFFANNFWTFSNNKITSWTQVPWKFIQYNIVAFGSVVIQFIFLRVGETFFGVAHFKSPIINLPIIRLYSWYLLFYMAGVGVGMVWNFIMYSKVVWKKNEK